MKIWGIPISYFIIALLITSPVTVMMLPIPMEFRIPIMSLCVYLALILVLLEDNSTLKPLDKITTQIFRILRLEPLKSTKIVFYGGINLVLFILI